MSDQKPKYPYMMRGPMIEVGTGKPGYRWVQGWIVWRDTERSSIPMRRSEALAFIRDLKEMKE